MLALTAAFDVGFALFALLLAVLFYFVVRFVAKIGRRD